jgi:hypothetical protein
MQGISATTISAKNSTSPTAIWLYEIELAASTGYYTENVESVTWNSNTYVLYPIKHDKMVSGGSSIPGLQLTVGDVDNAFTDYVRDHDFRGHKVVVTQVMADSLADTLPMAQATFWIGLTDPYSIMDNVVTFSLASVWSRQIQIPTKRFNREDFPQLPRSRTGLD